MKIELKVKDVEGMTDEKRHILLVDEEEIIRCLMQRKKFVAQCIVKEILLKDKKLMSEIIEDKQLRNTIYMQEKALREKKAAARSLQEQHRASVNYRKQAEFIHHIIGWDNEES